MARLITDYRTVRKRKRNRKKAQRIERLNFNIMTATLHWQWECLWTAGSIHAVTRNCKAFDATFSWQQQASQILSQHHPDHTANTTLENGQLTTRHSHPSIPHLPRLDAHNHTIAYQELHGVYARGWECRCCTLSADWRKMYRPLFSHSWTEREAYINGCWAMRLLEGMAVSQKVGCVWEHNGWLPKLAQMSNLSRHRSWFTFGTD